MRTLIIFLLFLSSVCFSQIVDVPDVKFVTVDPTTGLITLEWDKSTTPGIIDYEVLNQIKVGQLAKVFNFPFSSSINNIVFSRDTLLNKSNAVCYTVKAHATNYSLTDDCHKPILLNLYYDSCNSKINLTWNAYQGWEVIRYNVYDFLTSQLVGSTTETNYIIKDVTEKTNYAYYVEAIGVSSEQKSTSFRVTKYTDMPKSPDYIISSVSVADSSINLIFSIDPSSEVNHFILQRSNAFSTGFNTIKDFSSESSNIIHFTDQDVDVKNTIYYYQLSSVNSCGIQSTNSDIANNIVLTIENLGIDNVLGWESYKARVKNYQYTLHRVVNDIEMTVVSGTYDRKKTDNLSELQNYNDKENQKFDARFCYYVSTFDDTLGFKSEVRSNQVCTAIISDIKIPDAFTPNGDGKNDTFRPLFDFFPNKFHMIIYNRWGIKIFETTDVNNSWDGKVNGKAAEEGVYVYSISYTSFDKRTNFKAGNITVVYP